MTIYLKGGLRGVRRVETSVQEALRDFSWLVSSKGQKNREKLADLKGKFAQRRCFVMGNGPSLLKCDLSILKDEVTIGSNAQFLIWDQMGFKPTFLTVEDRLVAEDRAEEFCKLSTPIKIFPRDLMYCLGDSENTIFINFIRSYKSFPKFSSAFEKVVFWGGTVSVLNLQLAYYLGCTEIYLIGFDHQYELPNNPIGHVFLSQEDDVNHIHPDYFGKGYRWHDPNLGRMERGYAEARRFLNARGVIIKNATIGGKLEIFERVDYEQLFVSRKGVDCNE